MMRLIDAEELMKQICEYECGMHPEECDGMESETVACNFYSYVSEMPTVEAQHVMHGEWIPAEMNAENKENAEMLGVDIETFLSKAAYCSYCGIQQITNGRDRTHQALIHKAIYRYCPSCGVKMDGGNADG